MCAVILIFAFAMSLVINLGERMIDRYNEEHANNPEPGEVFAAEKNKRID